MVFFVFLMVNINTLHLFESLLQIFFLDCRYLKYNDYFCS